MHHLFKNPVIMYNELIKRGFCSRELLSQIIYVLIIIMCQLHHADQLTVALTSED